VAGGAQGFGIAGRVRRPVRQAVRLAGVPRGASSLSLSTRQRRADHNGERAAICDAELSVGPVEVDLHSGLRDGGFPRNLFVGQPLVE
jgi:hypothetical protein